MSPMVPVLPAGDCALWRGGGWWLLLSFFTLNEEILTNWVKIISLFHN